MTVCSHPPDLAGWIGTDSTRRMARLAHVAATDVRVFRQLLTEEFGDSPLFVLKDPRICRFVNVTLRALEHSEFNAS